MRFEKIMSHGKKFTGIAIYIWDFIAFFLANSHDILN